jgi:Uroporphyrinogen decarboxylase (URO-D)
MDSMIATERIETVIRLGKPDRVPVAPMLDMFSARYGGITQHEMFFDVKKADQAMLRTIEGLGRIDALHLTYAGLGGIVSHLFPVPPRLPGVDGVPPDAEFQFVEKSVIEPEDYLEMEKQGFGRWFLAKLRTTHPELSSLAGLAGIGATAVLDMLKVKSSIRKWRARGVEVMLGPNMGMVPIEAMSMIFRSLDGMVLDMFRHPEELKAGCRAMMESLKKLGTMEVLFSGVKRIFLGGTRSSATFLSPRQFEEFALPQWLELAEYFIARGITPFLHLDSDWTAFFPYLREMPRGKCILDLDGTSDIFQAKEVLGDHMCIMGDVPAALLKLGEPEEVDEYCRRLITEVGADGGFILSSGCSVPLDAKPENVKAILASVHRYRP